MDAFLDNGKEYQASPSSSRGDQTNLALLQVVETTSLLTMYLKYEACLLEVNLLTKRPSMGCEETKSRHLQQMTCLYHPLLLILTVLQLRPMA